MSSKTKNNQKLGRTMIRIVIFVTVLISVLVATEKKLPTIPEDSAVLATLGKNNNPYATISSKTIKVFAWNIYKGRKDNWRNDFLKNSAGHDILLLQEAYLDPAMISVFEHDTPYRFDFAASFLDYDGDNIFPTGVAIGSLATPKEIAFLRSSGREPVISILAKYDLAFSSKQLMVATIHALNFVSTDKLEAQLTEVAQVLSTHKGPLIWAGDFNTWSMAKLIVLDKIMARLGMRTVFFNPDIRSRLSGNPLDHIYVRGFEVLSSSVIDAPDGSDHQALSATLRFR